MSINRDQNEDIKKTEEIFDTIFGKSDGRNWLGHKHGSGASKIDAMLLVGATKEELDTVRGAVNEHLRHLEEQHGMQVLEENERFRFTRP